MELTPKLRRHIGAINLALSALCSTMQTLDLFVLLQDKIGLLTCAWSTQVVMRIPIDTSVETVSPDRNRACFNRIQYLW